MKFSVVFLVNMLPQFHLPGNLFSANMREYHTKESIFVQDLRIILFVMVKGFLLNTAKEFFNILIN